jgi:hypothetical protein
MGLHSLGSMLHEHKDTEGAAGQSTDSEMQMSVNTAFAARQGGQRSAASLKIDCSSRSFT